MTEQIGIEDFLPSIEEALKEACCFEQGCPSRLAEAIRYALLAPGKRLRPGLVLMATEACGGRRDDAMPAAVAIEMIHAYSLVHDDLPAMDDDDLRRGRPTVHVAFDEPTAILVGDALQAEAFSHLVRCNTSVDRIPRVFEAIRVLSVAAGPGHLVGGQYDDLVADGSIDSVASAAPLESSPLESSPSESSKLEKLKSIHRRKTGALFSAALDLGAIFAGAKAEQRSALGRYARDLGLAFQIVDDLLDFTADEKTMGKRVGKDVQRGKLTYPGLLGLPAARDKASRLIQSARQHVGVFGSSGWRLTMLADYVLKRSV
ncbi:Farnesyl diphosphate synthase [Novipirellula aureliae]|uniref:Farnesyl diphosphate synthase n=1 Tax=Novipirellula aureliae TaxID=2527966 RepID=A0A5C6E223_9BACT|nr:polyprenyl synthetase family protein [Novipirellula aureliae]TWU42950.1 Farnesyl diphosphate synthase [Novipirellula aureliae]